MEPFLRPRREPILLNTLVAPNLNFQTSLNELSMKKFLKVFYALLIGVLSVGFVSCGDDDDEPQASILDQMQGTWTLYKARMTNPDGESRPFDYDQMKEWGQQEGIANLHELDLRINSDRINNKKIFVKGNTFTYQDVAAYQGITLYVSFLGQQMIIEYDGTGVNEGWHTKFVYDRN